MKQVLQDLRNGRIEVAEVPVPSAAEGRLLIRTRKSLISAGTERMLVEFGRTSLIGKARSQPDKVRQVLDKIRAEGVLPTLEAVFRRLREPLPLGYCNAGIVVEVGPGVEGFAPGDRVASNGPHAEYVSVPKHLCARIPEGVEDEEAAFTVLGSVALQGVRLARPELGDCFAVFGAGLIGLLALQLLLAGGCRVLAVDIDEARLELARRFGAVPCNASREDPAACATAWSGGRGVDGVLVTASSSSDEIMHQAAQASRKRGRIVVVGGVGMNLRRADFYEKELTCQVSCSYGPGRYDEEYEERGRDYPFAFVRWTEGRNLEAVLSFLAAGRFSVKDLVTHRFPLVRAPEAYEKILGDPSTLGVILDHGEGTEPARTVRLRAPSGGTPPQGECAAALVGAGNFAKVTLAPALAGTGARLKYVAARTGAPAARYLAGRYGFEKATTDVEAVLSDPAVNTLFIATSHRSHAALARRALEAGKHVYLEKPMAVTPEELEALARAVADHPELQFAVGFNRRFSPHTRRIRGLLEGRREPLAMHFTCNAGILPPGAWQHRSEEGGRIVGEACHFVDLLCFLAGARVVSVAAVRMGPGVPVRDDKMCMALTFEDGSVGTVDYFGNGCKAYPKEMLEIFSEGRVVKLENFRRTRAYGARGFRSLKTRLDKGHRAAVKAFVERVAAGGEPLMDLRGLVNVTLATFAALTAAREGRTIHLDEAYPWGSFEP